ncbi:MAG: Cosmid L247 [uncultured Solirubrobacterales bacterium]|uniref:Cosmid L247 n=1 Tax=uncultured Solirubrobacterales bacterium TaxID=768556 RepID=A0A6J4SCC5_9ACTN|nr:MAG: Cosmid L247 [uncultured Solirubrobacterales bacterium]
MTSAHETELRETIEALAATERAACSPGERWAAEWIAARLRDLGCDAQVEEELSFPSYAGPMAAMGALGMLGGLLALGGRRKLGGVAAAVMAAAVADDASNGRRWVRRLIMRQRPTWNVVATAGDASAARALVVMAHHDAAPTGFIFDPAPQRRLWERFPRLVERFDTSFPLWWLGIGPALGVVAGAILERRRLIRASLGLSTFALACMLDVARGRVVPGANDNLSGVAGLVALAAELRERPIAGLRVVLVSCGAEETLQGGVYGFAASHFPSLAPDRTWFVNLETVGSTHLALLEGEGPVVMEYYEPRFKDLVAEEATRAGLELRRGLRSRASTDSVIPHRAGYPIATLISLTDWKALANYHWPTDTPENVDYATVARAVRLTERVARRLAVG